MINAGEPCIAIAPAARRNHAGFLPAGMLLEEKLHRAAGWAGLFAGLPGLIALFGCAAGVDFLRDFRPETPAMKVNTALCLVLASASLWLQHRGRCARGIERLDLLAHRARHQARQSERPQDRPRSRLHDHVNRPPGTDYQVGALQGARFRFGGEGFVLQ